MEAGALRVPPKPCGLGSCTVCGIRIKEPIVIEIITLALKDAVIFQFL
jgi:hypothetical protein